MHQVKEKGVILKFITTNKKALFPMTTVTEFVQTFQQVFGAKANELAKKQGSFAVNGPSPVKALLKP
jgi:hypothetical protein